MPVVMCAVGRPASYEGYPSGGKTRFFSFGKFQISLVRRCFIVRDFRSVSARAIGDLWYELMKFLLSDDASMAKHRAAREKTGIIARIALGIRAVLRITIGC